VDGIIPRKRERIKDEGIKPLRGILVLTAKNT
jgi:hypothetical protein